MANPTCDQHPRTELLPDSFGHWYCPDCDDEAHAAQIDKGVPHAGRLPAGSDSLLTPEPGSPPYLIPKRVADGRGGDFLARLNAFHEGLRAFRNVGVWALGDAFELREATRWVVHCAHCGVQLVGDTPQTDKAFEALKRSLADRRCRNPNCVTNGGTERRRSS